MNFVGIDVSKYKHDCAVVGNNGEVLVASFSFNNDCDGFASLLSLLSNLKGEIKIGLESTGHYGQNLKLFLEANNFSFMEINSIMIKKFISCKTLRRTKTDSLDSMSIAQYLITSDYVPYPKSFHHFETLKSLTRFRLKLVRQRSHQLVSITNILDKIFPEIKPFFRGELSFTALYILNRPLSKPSLAIKITKASNQINP